jgi:hypothetical protein
VLTCSERYCKRLLTCRRMICISPVACSGSVQVRSVDPVSYFHTVRYKLTTWTMHAYGNVLEILCNHFYIGNATMLSVCFSATCHFHLCIKMCVMYNNVLCKIISPIKEIVFPRCCIETEKYSFASGLF